MSRDKKIEEMAKVIASVPPLKFAVDGRCQGKHIYTLNKFAETLYEAGYRKQSESFSRPHENDGEWISVEERLPEAECPVLIFTRKNRYYVGYYYKALIDQTFTGFYADAVKRDVTHWMPLPEAPKKGGGE